MKIPSKFKVGRKVYRVSQPEKVIGHPPALGRINLDEQTIQIGMRNARNNKLRTDKERFQTFWHEATHAMLADMGSPKGNDEIFVDALAKRIVSVMYSVEF